MRVILSFVILLFWFIGAGAQGQVSLKNARNWQSKTIP